MKKGLLAVGLTLVLAAGTLSGCGASSSDQTTQASGKYKIGIAQFAEHGSLDNCRKGFIEGLAEEGFVEGENLEIQYDNAQADMGIANQMSQNFVAQKMDLICAIATPSAQSSFNAATKTDIPVIYTAVTDPVAAQLAKEDKMPTGNASGTSDKLPVEAQLKMIREIMPDAKKIGILYNTSEVNSVTTIKEYKDLADTYGFEIVDSGVSAQADIPLAVDQILGKVDCITNLTDNLVVSSLPTLLAKAGEKNIPVFGSEVEQVKIGCLASEGIEYVELGKQTGRMAAKVLKGEAKASDMPYEKIETSSLYLNRKVAEDLGITFSKELTERAIENFDTVAAK